MRRLFALSLTLLVSGCPDTDKGTETGETGLSDADGDGFLARDDCDDDDPAAHPGAAEVCDEVDNNCDGAVDEGVTMTLYLDIDEDGYGDAAEEGCAEGFGLVSVAGDCDDADAAIYPGADDVCDDVDNDCDDLVDEGLLIALYADADGDGYGVETSVTEGCEETEGWSAQSGDCDDADPAKSPGTPEVCEDGLDQNCDDLDARCDHFAAEVSLEYAESKLLGEEGSAAGSVVRPAGDVDGDGLTDLLVAMPDYSQDWIWQGAVALVLSPVSGDRSLEDQARSFIVGSAMSEGAGSGISRGEDLDRDGVPDLLIGAPGHLDVRADVHGAAFVFYGPLPEGQSELGGADALAIPDDDAHFELGLYLSTSPDLTGDDLGDALVGSSGGAGDAAGRVWILEGPLSGTVQLADALQVTGEGGGDCLGDGVDGVGDLDGDGYYDLAVSAWADPEGGTRAGSVGIFYGPIREERTLGEADRKIVAEEANSELGHGAVGGRGDVNGDGLDDLLLAATEARGSVDAAGAAFLMVGDATATGSLSVDATAAGFFGGFEQQRLGTGLDIVGDLDADGYAEILIGSPGHDGAGESAGSVAIYYGPVSGAFELGAEDATFPGEAAGDGLGTSVAGLADASGDGLPDLLLGAWAEDSGGDGAGAAYLFLAP